MMKALILDLDGCLVDSENLALAVIASEMRRLGATDVSESDLGKQLLGYNMSQIAKFVAEKVGQPTGKDFASRINGELMARYPQELKPIAGAHSLLEFLVTEGRQTAVATGSSIDRMQTALNVADLEQYFDGTACSSDQVENGKPSPDIFLFAAERLGRAPKDCLVLEDSPHGVAAAKSAGMTPLGFVGGSHLTDRQEEHAGILRTAGCVQVFHSLNALEILARQKSPLLLQQD